MTRLALATEKFSANAAAPGFTFFFLFTFTCFVLADEHESLFGNENDVKKREKRVSASRRGGRGESHLHQSPC